MASAKVCITIISNKDIHCVLRSQTWHSEFGDNVKKGNWPSDVTSLKSVNFKTKTLILILSFNIEHKIADLMTIKFLKYKVSF